MNRRYTDTLQSKESRQCHRRVVAATMTIVSVGGSPCKSIRLFPPTVETSVLCIKGNKEGWILIDFEFVAFIQESWISHRWMKFYVVLEFLQNFFHTMDSSIRMFIVYNLKNKDVNSFGNIWIMLTSKYWVKKKERKKKRTFFWKKSLNDSVNYYFSLIRKNTEVKRILKNLKYL